MFRNNQNADFFSHEEDGCDIKVFKMVNEAIFLIVSNFFMNQSFVTLNLQHNKQT